MFKSCGTHKKRCLDLNEAGEPPAFEARKSTADLEEEPRVTKESVVKLQAELIVLQEKLEDAEERAAKAEERAKQAESMAESLRAKQDATEFEDESDDESRSSPDDDPWSIMYRQLREYRMIHGDCNVPQKSGDNIKLGTWVNNQKIKYRNVKTGKNGTRISQERINKLDSIGFNWGKAYPPPKSWEESFADLKKFRDTFGHCNVPHNPTNPTPLAKWVTAQRVEGKRFRKGRDSLLTLDQIQRLNDVGFKWKVQRKTSK